MKEICMIYDKTETDISVFLGLFFRFIGVYVYEYVIDFNNTTNEDIPMVEYDFFMYILIRGNENPTLTKEIKQLKKNKNKILEIIIETDKESLLLPNMTNLYVENRNSSIALSIIRHLTEMQSIKKTKVFDVIEIEKLLALFEKYDLLYGYLTTKFFYKDNDLFQRAVHNYKKVLLQLQEIQNSYYSQMAILNCKYEINLLDKKQGKELSYNTSQLLKECERLALSEENTESLKILKGQIYEELRLDAVLALKEYLECEKDFNSFAFYRIGVYLETEMADSERAILWYEKSLRAYPINYRVQYRKAYCCRKAYGSAKAIADYLSILNILQSRFERNQLRTMEIDYLFKVAKQIANIYYVEFNLLEKAVYYYKMAKRYYASIDNSIFINRMKNSHMLIEIVKKNLNIEEVEKEIEKIEREMELYSRRS